MSRLTANADGAIVVVLPESLLSVLHWQEGDEVQLTLLMSAADGSRVMIVKPGPRPLTEEYLAGTG